MVVHRLAYFSPGRIIIVSLIGIILVGTLCLALPAAQARPIHFLDLIFTATSALCVTGLWTVPLDHFTFVGHCIVLMLMQVGGLGLITLTIFLLSLFTELGFTMQLMVGKLLDLETWRGIKRLLILIICLTSICECVGTLCFLPTFLANQSFGYALFLAFFHAVSSFCNAGITLLSPNLTPYKDNYLFLFITALLIFLGGLGFVTWNELIVYARAYTKKKRHFLSLHSKIILYGSLAFVVASMAIIFLSEYNHAFVSMSWVQGLFYSFFHALSWRSAGFLCLPFESFQTATLFLCLGISFIGSSPSSTGSGVKITTFIVFLKTLKAAVLSKHSVDIYGRRIPDEQVHKAIAIIGLSALWILIATFVLTFTQEKGSFFSLFAEVTSAFTNLGLSHGITPLLSGGGKVLIMISIIAGRIGSLALILAILDLAHQRRLDKVEFSYPEERIMLG